MWQSPVVMIRKNDGSYRLCVDYQQVNKLAQPEANPLPRMDYILSKLRRAKYLSTLALGSAYHTIPLKASLRPVSVFKVPGLGLSQYKRLPFGLSGAPASFQRLLDSIITRDLEPYGFGNLDDVTIATNNLRDHMKYVKIVISKLQKARLVINLDKSVFGNTEVRYLGFVVNGEGLKPDVEKIRPIIDYPVPKNLKQLRRYVELFGWYQKFINDYAKIAEP